jgi:hypothetical protein
MAARLPAAVLIVLAALAAKVSAQTISLSIGPGIAYADGQGRSALVAFETHWRVLLVRADARVVCVPDGVAEVGYAGVAAGAAPVVRGAGVRPYALAAVSRGVDFREADELTTVGVAAGLDWCRSHLFAELRYENSLQRSDPFHYRLPEHQWTLCGGLRLGWL